MANATKDKIIILAPNGDVKGVTGLLDPRLFTGQNKLHAVLEENGLWSMHYDSGIVQEPLRQKFTSFSMLLRAVVHYYGKRNVKIKEIIE